MNMDKHKTNKKNEQMIRILRPLNYLCITIITLFSAFITYGSIYGYSYTKQWWKYDGSGKLIMVFIISSLLFSLLFKIGNRLFQCKMSLQILIYATGTMISIYLLYIRNLPPFFFTKYIFHYPQYLKSSLFFLLYYIVLSFGILFMIIILDSIDLILTLRSKREVEGRAVEEIDNVNPYKMPQYVDYQKRLISPEEKKGTKIFVIILFSLLSTILIIKLLGLGLETKGIYFRAWVNYLIYIIIKCILPLLLVSFFIFQFIFCKKETAGKVSKYIIKSEVLLLIVGMGMFIFMTKSGYQLVYETTIEKEEKMGNNYIISSNQFLFINNHAELTYYNHYNFFTKRKCTDDIQIIKAILKDRYHEDFLVNSEESNQYSFVAQATDSYFEFRVEKDNNNDYSDYYIMTEFYYYIQDYIFKHHIQWEIEPLKDYFIDEITVYINNDDLENRATELSEMISDLIKDEYFNIEGNCIDIVVICGKTKNAYNDVTLTIGDQFTKRDEYSKEYYTNFDHVYNKFKSAFSENIYATDKAEDILKGDSSDQAYGEEIDENDLSIPESAYKKLYEAIFEPMGFSYLLNYNAKGNLYGVLGTRVEEKDGESRTLRYTVVYDRQSKNGMCQLFVEYKDYVYPGTDEIDAYSTEIVEFYAVNMVTGKVVAANKTAWSQVGSDKYQEMTGEY